MRALLIAVVLASSAPAFAGKAVIAALAPAADARRAVAIGPAGEVYEPDGKGAWVRRQAGGTAEEIVAATAAAGVVFAIAKTGFPFEWKPTGWSVIRFGPKAKPIVGRGSRVLVAAGKATFALDGGRVVPLAEAPAAVLQIAGSARRAIAMTAKGLLQLQGAAWKPVKKAPRTVRTLVSDRWALVDKGALDLDTQKTITWPSGLRVDEATTAGDVLFAVGVKGKALELVTVKGGKIAREPIPSDRGDAVVGVAADGDGRVAVALRDGGIVLRVGGTWSSTDVRVEIPAARPGAPAATSQ